MKREKRNAVKPLTILLSVLLVGSLAVGGTLAYLTATDGPTISSFRIADVDIAVSEGKVVTNSSGVSVWIRAALVVNWVDENGNVYGIPPVADIDYTLTDENWIQGTDGFYYYSLPVAPGTSTSALAVSGTEPLEGYSLQVQLAAEAIQAVPAGAFADWNAAGISLNADGTALAEDGN